VSTLIQRRAARCETTPEGKGSPDARLILFHAARNKQAVTPYRATNACSSSLPDAHSEHFASGAAE
jgi:hypothetical protein